MTKMAFCALSQYSYLIYITLEEAARQMAALSYYKCTTLCARSPWPPQKTPLLGSSLVRMAVKRSVPPQHRSTVFSASTLCETRIVHYQDRFGLWEFSTVAKQLSVKVLDMA